MPADSSQHRVLFMGSKRLGVRALEALNSLPGTTIVAVTIDDRSDGRSAFGDLHAVCASRSIPCMVVRSRADASTVIADVQPELVVVCGWYWIVPRRDLERVPQGFVGIHFSPLPRYRGGSPLVWQLINGEREVGVSLFSFSTGVDEGPVWAQQLVAVGPDETIGEILPRLETAAVGLLTHQVPLVLGGHARPVDQDHARATTFPMRTPEDGAIRWDQPARRVHDFVRAQSHPYPGAFTFAEGHEVTIWRTRIGEPVDGAPGRILRSATGISVACGDGHSLIIERAGTQGRDVPAHEALPLHVMWLTGRDAAMS